MIQELLRRGIDDGTFPGGVSLRTSWASCSATCSRPQPGMAAEDLADVEKAAALVSTVFLHGTGAKRS